MYSRPFTVQIHRLHIEIDTSALSCTKDTLCLSFLKANLHALEKEKNHFLHPQELEKLTTYTSPLRRQSYLLGRIAAKEAIQAYTNHKLVFHEICIENGLSGEPNVIDYNIHISISHSKDYAICVATSYFIKIGIDIECLDHIREREAVFHTKEIVLFEKVNITHKVLAYALLWSAKEALVKCLGIGFVFPFSLLAIAHITIQDGHIMAEFTYFPTFQVLLFYTNSLVMAICIPKKVLVKPLGNFSCNFP